MQDPKVDLYKVKADVSSVSPYSERIARDERLTLETSAFKLFTVTNLRYQLSW